jgi:hypothetical protein
MDLEYFVELTERQPYNTTTVETPLEKAFPIPKEKESEPLSSEGKSEKNLPNPDWHDIQEALSRFRNRD